MSRTRSVSEEMLRYKWVSTARACEMIGGSDTPVTRGHVVELIKAGELTARNVGLDPTKRPEWRIDPASIDKFLEKRTLVIQKVEESAA